jgi:hypothetical protein
MNMSMQASRLNYVFDFYTQRELRDGSGRGLAISSLSLNGAKTS